MLPLRFFITFCFLAAIAPAHLQAAGEIAAGNDRPNIILMMADDLGWGDPHCFNPESPIKTPHLDAMAAAGLKFSRFYAAAPVCSPTRGSCITGRHPFRYGIYSANVGHMRPQELTLAELLKAHGYTTGHFGKWHLGTLTTSIKESNRGGKKQTQHFSPPQAHGFDICFSTEAKVPTWDPMLKPSQKAAQRGWNFIKDPTTATPYNTHYWNQNGEIVTDNLRGDDSRVIMDRVVPFIEQAANDQEPFFAVVWFHAPHLPVVAGPKHAAMYAEYDSFEKNYYGCITAMDEQIGRLRKSLQKAGVADNTMLWFCSDNGPEGSAKDSPGSAGNFRGRKRSLYEGGIRVPGILEWPARVSAGTTTEFPAVTSDYLPTIVDLLGAEATDDRPLDGISLLPVFAGEVTQRTAPIGFRIAKQRALITQHYKLYSRNAGTTWQLYDLLADPSESLDIADTRTEKVQELSHTYKKWQQSCEQSDRRLDY